MNRDALSALVTAILMVIGLIALNPGSMRGARHSDSSETCNFFNACSATPGYSENLYGNGAPHNLPGEPSNAVPAYTQNAHTGPAGQHSFSVD